MRMWLVNPKFMCRKHLLGEHYELHMIDGWIQKNKNLSGFIKNNLVFPTLVYCRHEIIVNEMILRGYNHKSSISENLSKETVIGTPRDKFGNFWNFEESLFDRCKECAMLAKMQKWT